MEPSVSVVAPIEIMVWSPDHSLCVPELDHEAQFGYQLINNFHAAMLEGKGAELMVRDFLTYHRFGLDFRDHVDELMTLVDYRERREHLEEHHEIHRKFMEFAHRIERGETTLSIEFSLFLTHWVEKHITNADHRLARHLRLREGAAAVRRMFTKSRHQRTWRWKPCR